MWVGNARGGWKSRSARPVPGKGKELTKKPNLERTKDVLSYVKYNHAGGSRPWLERGELNERSKKILNREEGGTKVKSASLPNDQYAKRALENSHRCVKKKWGVEN